MYPHSGHRGHRHGFQLVVDHGLGFLGVVVMDVHWLVAGVDRVLVLCLGLVSTGVASLQVEVLACRRSHAVGLYLGSCEDHDHQTRSHSLVGRNQSTHQVPCPPYLQQELLAEHDASVHPDDERPTRDCPRIVVIVQVWPEEVLC